MSNPNVPWPPGMILFPTEKQIGEAVLGDRAKEWPSIARYLEEKYALRKPHPMFGRRYWPHVVATIEAYLQGGGKRNLVVVEAEDGVEDFSGATKLRKSRRRSGASK